MLKVIKNKVKAIKKVNLTERSNPAQRGKLTKVTSKMYPLFEFKAKFKGEIYNNLGFNIGSFLNKELDSKIVQANMSLPYKFYLYSREDANSSSKVFKSLFGESYATVMLKESSYNPLTSETLDIEDIFENRYFNETDPTKNLRVNEYEGFVFYQDNYDAVLDIIMKEEMKYINSDNQLWDDGLESTTLEWFDYLSDDNLMDQKYLLNPFTCSSSKGAPLFSCEYDEEESILEDNQQEITMNGNNPIWLTNGSDGTMTDEEFEKLVVKDMERYADEDDFYMDRGYNVETNYYDSGYSLETKLELTNFVSLRKDTRLACTTHEDKDGAKYKNIEDSRALGIAIINRASLSKESEYFNTGVCRVLVTMGAGLLKNSKSKRRIPLTYDVINKTCKLMGSDSGAFIGSELFDMSPYNIVDTLTDIEPHHVPSSIKSVIWNDGISWAYTYDRERFFVPIYRTVYSSDTSILKDWIIVNVCGDLDRVAYEIWKDVTGAGRYSDDAFLEVVTNMASARLPSSKYANLYKIKSKATIDAYDKVTGYSWRLTNEIHANPNKTSMVYNTTARRMSQLTE